MTGWNIFTLSEDAIAKKIYLVQHWGSGAVVPQFLSEDEIKPGYWALGDVAVAMQIARNDVFSILCQFVIPQFHWIMFYCLIDIKIFNSLIKELYIPLFI